MTSTQPRCLDTSANNTHPITNPGRIPQPHSTADDGAETHVSTEAHARRARPALEQTMPLPKMKDLPAQEGPRRSERAARPAGGQPHPRATARRGQAAARRTAEHPTPRRQGPAGAGRAEAAQPQAPLRGRRQHAVRGGAAAHPRDAGAAPRSGAEASSRAAGRPRATPSSAERQASVPSRPAPVELRRRPHASAGTMVKRRSPIALLRRQWLQHAVGRIGTPAAPGRIPALDGLRALAVIGVVLYHARPQILPGGFLSVTLFFVITGFLTTRSIERELSRTGSFSYLGFIGRRLARLVPPVLVLIALTALGTYLVGPSLLPKVQADALPSALFYSNWANILRDEPYFAAAGLPSPLTHLWFLGVTMQLYLIWPLMLIAIARGLSTRERAVGCVGGLALLSTAAMAVLFDPAGNTARVYYGTDTRAAELLVGAGLALALPLVRSWRPDTARTAHPRLARAAAAAQRIALGSDSSTSVGCVCLVILGAAYMLANGESALLYRGGFLLAALLCALLALCVLQPESGLAAVLSWAPFTYLGTRSLSIYLVHYPLLTLMNPAANTTELPWWGTVLQLACVLAAAEAFYRLVEKPSVSWVRQLVGKEERTETPRKERTSNARATACLRALAKMRTRGAGRYVAADQATGAEAPDAQATQDGEPARSPSPLLDRLRAFSSLLPSPHYMTLAAALSASAVVTLAFVPVNWEGIARERAEALRPELTAEAAPTSDASGHGTSETAGPVAEKIPANLPWEAWSFDEDAGTCDANVLIVGDSVTETAQDALQEALPYARVDAVIGRQFYGSEDTITADEADFDAAAVVVALGGNGTINYDEQVQAVIDAAAGRPLYFVTIRCPLPLQDQNNAKLRAFAASNDNVGIIDWYGASEGHSEYLEDDGQHLTPTGVAAYTALIRQALCGR